MNCVGLEGETALLLAAAGGHHDVVRILLKEGADVNHQDNVTKQQTNLLPYLLSAFHLHSLLIAFKKNKIIDTETVCIVLVNTRCAISNFALFL